VRLSRCSLFAAALLFSGLTFAAEGPVPGLVWIKAGTFTMGSPDSEAGRHPDETQHQVTLTHGFWIGATELTVAQWRDVMGTDLRGHLADVIKDDTLYDFQGRKRTIRDFMNMSPDGDIGRYLGNEEDTLPMYFVSWNDAIEFCAKLTAREKKAGRLPAGYKYTLPTEAQWEYAVRAGTTGATFAPNIDDIAWYGANAAQGYSGKAVGRSKAGPRTAGLKQANAWGLHDMTGNLWEWCSDFYGPYPAGSVTDPTGPATGTARVNRGGSFGSAPGSVRSANRASNPQAEASAYRGFRLALTFGD
jgi:formylglycine-generating enzyme required for sulfatase activity